MRISQHERPRGWRRVHLGRLQWQCQWSQASASDRPGIRRVFAARHEDGQDREGVSSGVGRRHTRADVQPGNLRILRMFRTPGQRAHGLDVDRNFLWMLFSTDREVHKYDLNGGRLLEIIRISESEPDAHGLALKDGYLYYCDSGLTEPGPGSAPGQVCRFRVDISRATN